MNWTLKNNEKRAGGRRCEGGHWFACGSQRMFEINYTWNIPENTELSLRETKMMNSQNMKYSHEPSEEGAVHILCVSWSILQTAMEMICWTELRPVRC